MEEKKLHFGKLNSDSGDYALPKNDYLNARNVSILVPEGKDIGDVIGVEGTTLIATDLKSSTQDFRVTGSYEDVGANRIIYFLVEDTITSPDSFIMVYDGDSGNTYYALIGSDFITGTLGLSTNYLIHSVTMEGSMLIWTDNYNPPRKYNIDRGIKRYHPSYITDLEAYGNFESPKDIELIKTPPVYPPYLEQDWGTETAYGFRYYSEDYRISGGVNDLLGEEAFMFSTRFIYRDGEISVPSPYSKIVQPTGDIYKGRYGVKIKYMEGSGTISSAPFDAEWVELLVKYGNNGVTYIVDKVPADIYSTATFDFYNDSIGTALSDEYVAKDFESVPLLSETVESISNKVLLSGNTEGYDTPTETSLTITPYHMWAENSGLSKTSSFTILPTTTESIKVLEIKRWWGKTSDTSTGGVFTSEDPNNSVTIWLPVFYISTMLLAGWYYNPNINAGVDSDGDPTINATDWTNHYDDNFSEYVFLGKTDTTIMTRNGNDFVGVQDFYERRRFLPPTSVGSETISINNIPTYPYYYPFKGDIFYKSGSVYDFGIHFTDFAKRKSLVINGDDDSKLRTPKFNYNLYPITFQEDQYNVRWAAWSLTTGDEIPSWADQYQIVRTKSLSYNSFIQFKTTGLYYAYKNRDDDGTIVENGIASPYFGGINMSFRAKTVGAWHLTTGVYNEKLEALAISLDLLNNNDVGYSYNEGDLISIVSKRYGTLLGGEALKIIEVSGGYLFAEAVDIGSISTENSVISLVHDEGYKTDFVSNKDYYIPFEYHCEIMTPNKGDKGRYYEVSEVYDIVSGDYGVTSGKIRGDVYIGQRDGSIIEVMNRGDHWQRWETDAMRPNIDTSLHEDLGQVYKPDSLRWSGNYINETAVNNLNTFNAFDERIISEEIGDIKKLQVVSKVSDYGNILLVIGEAGTVAVYINENIMTDTQGDESVLQSTQFIGTVRELKGGFGTLNPESVKEYRGNVYWFDSKNESVVRYSSAGLFPVSDYGMKHFFKRVAAAASEVQGGIDPYSGEYLLTVPELDTNYIEYPTIWDGFSLCADNSTPVGNGYSATWEDYTCQKVDATFIALWGNHTCMKQLTTYSATWSDYVCQKTNTIYSALWEDHTCVKVDGDTLYEAFWNNHTCVKIDDADYFVCTWEDLICVDI